VFTPVNGASVGRSWTQQTYGLMEPETGINLIAAPDCPNSNRARRLWSRRALVSDRQPVVFVQFTPLAQYRQRDFVSQGIPSQHNLCLRQLLSESEFRCRWDARKIPRLAGVGGELVRVTVV
jgi:hypothetical protein